MERIRLRSVGDFNNKASVEYATIKVELPRKLVPSNTGKSFVALGLFVIPLLSCYR
jgi:hypothetical protein